MNRLRHHWQLLGLVGPRYPVLLLKALAFGRGCSSGSLSRFVGCGLEIGGPSQFFQSGREFPIYSAARNVDNVNYSKKTFWKERCRKESALNTTQTKMPVSSSFVKRAISLRSRMARTILLLHATPWNTVPIRLRRCMNGEGR